jgi:hypothetical protein
MYLRFQTKLPDRTSCRPSGILVAAADLRDSNRVSVADEKWLREHLDYYNMHLKIPACLKDWANRRALSWFCEGSKMIGRVWDLKAMMEDYDIFIEVLTTRNPGRIIYRDGHQVVAIPTRGGR